MAKWKGITLPESGVEYRKRIMSEESCKHLICEPNAQPWIISKTAVIVAAIILQNVV